ncbi:MAG TPA: AsmA-like C-terminal region-containing protein [Burkholderiales bacterium]|nr:AsmA-like C-terminal region-containing protein [Burkholderiales bacterium]
MNRRSILTKTGKGLMEATGKTSNLSRDLRNILKEIDGKVSVSELLEKFGKMPEPRLLEALSGMAKEGYLREFVGKQDEAPRAPAGRAPAQSSADGGGEDLDFTAFTPAKPSAKTGEDARLQAQAQEIARQAQATRAREQAAAKARAEAAARAKAGAEQKARLPAQANPKADAQARAQAEALDQARREAEERQRREAEARARIAAEQSAKRGAEERILREIQEKERREGEVRAKREADEKVRRDAEERLRREAEERARKDIEERMRREEVERRLREEREQAERRSRIEAEARAKVEADMRAERESEERARSEEEERPGREEEQRRRAEEDASKRREAEESEALERSLREQEEKARREAEQSEREEEQRREEEERARRESEEEAQGIEEEKKRAKEEERRAREDEKAQAKAAARTAKAARSKEKAGEEAWRGDEEARDSNEASLSAREIWAKRKPGSLAKQFAVMLLVILIVAVAALPFVPLERGPYEKAAQAWLGEPVTIGSVNLALLPVPLLKFERIVIGKQPQMRAAVIKAIPVITSLLEDPISLKSLELENVTFPREFLPALLQDKGRRGSLGVRRISAKGLKLDIPELNLPALDVDASLSPDGALQSVAFSNAERKLSVKLRPQGGKAGIEISADKFPLPLGMELPFGEFLAKGTVTRNELALSEVEARAFGGRLLGNARLRWSDGWSLEGDLAVRQMDAAKIAAPLLAGGTLQGKGAYSMKALLPERLLPNLRLEGNFTIQKGSITNVDMTRLLQGSGPGGGTTPFSEVSGGVSADANRLLVRQIRMAAGLLNGTGQGEMDPQKNLSGRMQIELRAQSVQARATLAVAGTLPNPQFRRIN